jgi:adenylate cyclase
MKLSFRLTILCILLGLIVATLTTVGISSYVYARLAAEDLAEQIIEQVSLGIDQQIERLLRNATERSAMTAKLLESGQLSRRDLGELLQYWAKSLETSPGITSSFIGLSATGEAAGVSLLQDEQLSIWQTNLGPDSRSLRLREFRLADYPHSPFREGLDGEAPDIRGRPWYVAASQSGRPIWTESYVFLGVGKIKQVLGITYATPLFGPDGRLDSVISVDFDLGTLCRYLKGLRVGRGGFAFIAEIRGEDLRVIAHPRPEILSDTIASGNAGGPTLVPIERIADGRIRTMLGRSPLERVGQLTAGPASSRFTHEGRNYIGNLRNVSGDDKPRWIICTVLPEDEILGFAHRMNRSTILVTIGAMIGAIILGIYVSGQVARPLEHLASEAAKVGHLRLTPRPVAHSLVLEVDRLAVAIEEMKGGLRSFRKYVPAELVRSLIDTGQDAKLGGERRRLTIFFSDIQNFTTISESLEPEVLLEQLGEYFDIFNKEIIESRGTVDKYIGDSVMAFWGAPDPVADHAASACLAALRIQRGLRDLRSRWLDAGLPALITRIGIHTGEVIVGNVGNESRMNYTVVGDAVNLASRLEGLNKNFDTAIMISDETYREASGSIKAKSLGQVTVKGRTGSVIVYELLESPPTEELS